MNINNKSAQVGVMKLFTILAIFIMSITLVWGLVYNGTELTDHTNYNETSNICSADVLNMQVDVYPCSVQDLDGKNIEQFVNFKWNGAETQETSWVFVYDGVLDSGSIEVETNQSYQVNIETEQWVSNYLITNIIAYENKTDENVSCDLGTARNSQKFNVTYDDLNQTSEIICFETATTSNATSFYISGWAMLSDTEIRYKTEWVDHTSSISYLGYDLLGENLSYYEVQSVDFNPNQEIKTKWTYTPKDNIKSGKWSIFGYSSDMTIQQAISSETYLFLDPWWNSSWGMKRELSNLTGNFSYMNLTYDSGMQADFDDLRFTNSDDDLELNYTISEKSDSNWVTVRVHSQGASSIYMYYGNSGATTTSSASDTYFNPISSYYLDEISGTTVYDAVLANNGTVNDARVFTSEVAGIINTGADLTQGTDHVNINSLTSEMVGASTITYSFWIQRSDSSTTRQDFKYISGGYVSNVGWIRDNQIGFFARSRNGGTGIDARSAATLLTDTTNYHHIVGVIDYTGKYIAVYIDADLKLNQSAAFNDNTLQTGITTFRIGASESQTNPANIDVDEMKIYDKALTPDQIYQLYTENEPTYVLGSEEVSNPTPTLTANATKPDTVYINTDWLINLTATDPEETYIDSYVQFWNDTSKIGGEYTFNMTNNTNHLVATLVSGNFSNTDNLTAQVWLGDRTTNSSKVNLTAAVTITYPQVSNITWITNLGFTDDTLTYNQILEHINATCSDLYDLIGCNVTFTNPSSVKILDNVPMTGNFTYDSNVALNETGIWTINVTGYNSLGEINSTASNITVLIQTQSIRDGWYGYANNSYLTSGEITTLSGYDYDIFEFEDNMTELQPSFATLLTSINDSRNLNIKSSINIILDFDYNDSGLITQYLNVITANFSVLNTVPYLDSVTYISLELENLAGYSDAIKGDTLNTFAERIINVTDNEFVVYSNNYNSSTLDASYIKFTEMLYFTSSTAAEFIQDQKNAFKNNASLNRIYNKISDAIKVQAGYFHSDVIDKLRGTVNPDSITNVDVGSLSNKDIIVFNNGSSAANFSLNVSELDVSGKDVWDSTFKRIIEMDTDENITVEVEAYNTTVIYFEDLSHIKMDSLSTSVLYTGGGTSEIGYSNYTDGGVDGNFGLAGAYDIQIELPDPHYISNNFMTYYGWLNTSTVDSPKGWENYDVVIFSDENNAEIDALNFSATDFYAYVSVADYNNTQGWTDVKIAKVDDWLALNGSLNIFVDGMDTGVGGTNFSSRMKDLIDYIQITKLRKGLLNTYTAYDDFSTWGTGGVMKESCVNRWNGISASTPDNYTREDWDLELERSQWLSAHSVEVYCQAFDNRSTDGSNTIMNYTELQNIFFASKVLGYEYFYLSQPDFQVAHSEFVYDVGESLDRNAHQLPSDTNTYYRTYEEGIVYYNTTSEQGWIDDGLVVNNMQTCFYLYNPHIATPEWRFNINLRNPHGSVGEYVITKDWGVGTWKWKCVDTTNETPVNGRYLIEAWVGDHTTIVGQGYNLGWSIVGGTGVHSWYDTSTTDSFTAYAADQNWMVNISSNITKGASIDTTNLITQDSAAVEYYENITLGSDYSFPIETWSLPITSSNNFANISYLNSTNWVILNYVNDTSCDSGNPIWGVTTIESQTFKACIEENASGTIVRVAAPSLSTKVFKINSANPEISVISPGNNIYSDSDIYVNTSTSLPIYNWWLDYNGTNYTFTPNSTFTFLDGSHDLKVYANSTIGFWGSNDSINFTVDSVFPVVSFSTGTEPNNTAVGQEFIYVNVSVTEDNEENITFYLYNESSVIYDTSTYSTAVREKTWTSLPAGIYYYNVTVTDIAGNAGSSPTRKITLLPIPEISTFSPVAYSVYAYNNLYVNATADIAIADWRLDYNGTNYTFTPNSTFTFLDGTHNINIYANSTDNIMGSKTIDSVVVDTIPPTVTLNSPTNGSTYNSSRDDISVNFSVSDANFLSCAYNITNGTNFNATCNTNISYLVESGNNDITYYATDTAGNIGIAKLSIIGGAFVVNISNETTFVEVLNGTSYWEENASLTFNSSAPSTSWFEWLVGGASKLAGWGENVFNWVFNLTSDAPNATVTLENIQGDVVNSFNNSLTTENITFTGNENFTRWLSIPEDTIVVNGFLNLSGHLSTEETDCYQESANVSDQTGIDGDCGLNYTGNYGSIVGDWNATNGAENVMDGDYDSYGTADSGTTNYVGDIIYYKPIDATGATWTVKSDNGITNITLSDKCYDSYTDRIRLRVNHNFISNSVLWMCWEEDDSHYNNELFDAGASYAYEEAMIWKIGSNIANTSLLINETQVWNHTGEFNSTFSPNTTSDMASVINDYTTAATAVGGYHQIPFIFHSDTAGILEYSSINITGGVATEEEFLIVTASAAPVFNLVNVTTPIIYNPLDNVSVDFNVSDINLDSCWYNYNLTNTTFACTSAVEQELNITSQVGYTDITFYANDSVGNMNSTLVNFTFDESAPVITLISPANGSTYNSSWDSIDINFSVSDDNLDSCSYNITNGTSYSTTCNTNISYLIQEGTNVITYYALDSIENIGTANLSMVGGYFVVNISNDTANVVISNGTSYWEENASLTFNSSAPSTNWFDWIVAGVSELAGWGENVFNWVFNLTSDAPNATVILNSGYLCYQESVNVSNQTGTDGDCNLNYSGNYSYLNIANPENFIDGNSSTYSDPTTTTSSNYYITYAKPALVYGAILHFKYADSGVWSNLTIQQSCLDWDEDYLQLKISTGLSGNPILVYCYDDGYWSGWSSVTGTNSNQEHIWEEGIYWNTSIVTSGEFLIVTASAAPVLNLVNITTPIIYNPLDNVSVDFNVSDENLDSCWYDYNSSNTTFACTAEVEQTLTITSAIGETNITFYANDTLGNTNSTMVNFTYDYVWPVVNVTAPSGEQPQFTYGDNLTLEYNISKVGYNASHFDRCWFDHGTNTNVTLNCSRSSYNFTHEPGYDNITVFVEDILGLTANDTTSWDYILAEVNQTFESSVYETHPTAYEINEVYNSSRWTTVTGEFVYNETSYTATVNATGNNIVMSYSQAAPVVAIAENFTFYWVTHLTNATGIYSFNSTSNNQTVSKVTFSLCNFSDTPQLYFETFSTTSPLDNVNATFSSAWDISDTGGGEAFLSRSYEELSETRSNWSFCVAPNSSNYTISVSIVVDATDYTPTSHYIVSTNYSYGITQNVSLYLLSDNDSVLTQIVTRDKNNQPVEGVYTTIQRYDIGTDTYYNVGMTRSDNDGSDLAYLSWYDIWYVFVGVQDETVVFTEGPKKISETPQIFYTGVEVEDDYVNFRGILYDLYYNDASENFVLTYVAPDGVSSSNCLRVYKRNVTNDYLICDVCEVSTSATMYCDTTAYGNGTFIADFYATGSPREWIDTLTTLKNIQNEFYEMLGNDNGTGLAIILAGIVLSMFLITPALGILGMILGMAGAMAMGFQPLDYTAFIGIIAVGIAMMWAVQK